MPRRYLADTERNVWAQLTAMERVTRHSGCDCRTKRVEHEGPILPSVAHFLAPHVRAHVEKLYAPGTVHTGTVQRKLLGGGFIVSLGTVNGFLSATNLGGAEESSIERSGRVRVRVADLDGRLCATLTRQGL